MQDTKGEKLFQNSIAILFILLAFVCLFPILNVLAISFSSGPFAEAGLVSVWPKGFTLASYEYTLQNHAFIRAFIVSLERVGLGVIIGLLITVITSYPLSKSSSEFPQRGFYVWFFLFTTLFTGGVVPWYMTIQSLHLINTLWALVVPSILSVFNVLMVMNFFRTLPKELSESAFMDGAGHMATLWKIIIPISKPVLATITLFIFVGHWNSWFDGLILINSQHNYPLQTYLQTLIVNISADTLRNATKEQLETMLSVSNRTFKASQIFVASLPIFIIYPFLQKYFVKGIVLGSVKE